MKTIFSFNPLASKQLITILDRQSSSLPISTHKWSLSQATGPARQRYGNQRNYALRWQVSSVPVAPKNASQLYCLLPPSQTRSQGFSAGGEVSGNEVVSQFVVYSSRHSVLLGFVCRMFLFLSGFSLRFLKAISLPAPRAERNVILGVDLSLNFSSVLTDFFISFSLSVAEFSFSLKVKEIKINTLRKYICQISNEA